MLSCLPAKIILILEKVESGLLGELLSNTMESPNVWHMQLNAITIKKLEEYVEAEHVMASFAGVYLATLSDAKIAKSAAEVQSFAVAVEIDIGEFRL